jgi:lantibiotic modifying enzyme
MENISQESKEKIADLISEHSFLEYSELWKMFFVMEKHEKQTERDKMKFAIKMVEWYGLTVGEGGEVAIHEALLSSDSKYREVYKSLETKIEKLKEQDLACLKNVLIHKDCTT